MRKVPNQRTELGTDRARVAHDFSDARLRGVLDPERGRDCRSFSEREENHAQLLAGHRARQVFPAKMERSLAHFV